MWRPRILNHVDGCDMKELECIRKKWKCVEPASTKSTKKEKILKVFGPALTKVFDKELTANDVVGISRSDFMYVYENNRNKRADIKCFFLPTGGNFRNALVYEGPHDEVLHVAQDFHVIAHVYKHWRKTNQKAGRRKNKKAGSAPRTTRGAPAAPKPARARFVVWIMDLLRRCIC